MYINANQRTIYNVIYQNGRGRVYYMKRFAAMSRDKVQPHPRRPCRPDSKDSVVLGQSNGEAEVVKITLTAKLRLKNLTFDVDFCQTRNQGAVPRRATLVTKNEV